MKDLSYIEAWSVPEPNSGCWLWLGATAGRDRRYGVTRFEGRQTYAHRVAYAVATGGDPGAFHVCHRCDNTFCVNPDHLFLGTPQDNVDDMFRKGRNRSGDHAGIRNGRAKITTEDAERIRAMRATGAIYRVIGEHFGISVSAVYQIIAGNTWTVERNQE